jgi:diguanylate cyclase (GGDEF)-like protein
MTKVFDQLLPLPGTVPEGRLLVLGLTGIVLIALADNATGSDIRLNALHLIPLATIAYLALQLSTVAIACIASITLQFLTVHFSSLRPASIVVDISTAITVAALTVVLARKAQESVLNAFQSAISDKLQVALESMSDAVFISDVNGYFIDFNLAFATFHRFTSKDDCARHLDEYPALLDVLTMNGEMLPLEKWAVPRALKGEVGTGVEFRLRLKASGEEWIGSYNYAPIRDKTGLIVGSVVTGRDVTERKHTEEELHRYQDHLEEIVASRTSELATTNEKLTLIARQDALTQLPNRLSATERLLTEFMTLKRSNIPYAVLMIDIDLFKHVNDTYGHAIGDEVLQKIAKSIKATLRESDFSARFGGEEFIAILPGTTVLQAQVVANKLRVAIQTLHHHIAGNVTVSIGLALANAAHANESVAVKEADDCLYEAKRTGRNRVVFNLVQ